MSKPLFQEIDSNVILLIMIILHVILTPYTKVEESFNLQAIHDMLESRFELSEYDHFDYPGVVPRSCIGAIIVSLLSFLPHRLMMLLALPKENSQYMVRIVLGILSWKAFVKFREGVDYKFRDEI